jgi:ribulose-5-phosphate 4-epimerase/fuculose-1-phosphate aldolase
MAESGLFDVVCERREVPQDARIPQLIGWAAKFAALGWTPSYGAGDHGNLSCRTPGGFLMSARATVKAALQAEQFVEVLGLELDGERPRLRCRGTRLPSTDALLHWRLYERRPDVQAILHAHDSVTLARAAAWGLPVTAHSAARPSTVLIEEAADLAAAHDYLVLRDHGFLSLGRSIEEAGERALTQSRHEVQ